jgi:hypothetical protein
MTKRESEHVRLRVIYRGSALPGWRGGDDAFGIQDKSNDLHAGGRQDDGSVVFDLSVEARPSDGAVPVLLGPFAHGPPAKRFLYLSWRNPAGGYARRLKLPLAPINWRDIAAARDADQPLVAEVVDEPKLTTTGVHIGGTRAVEWIVIV